MSAIDQAFIRAYEIEGPVTTAAPRAAAAATHRSAANPSFNVVETIAEQPAVAKGVQSLPMPVAAPMQAPRTSPASSGIDEQKPPQDSERRPLSAFSQSSPVVEGRFKPALEVDSFRWPVVSQQLLRRCRHLLQGAVAAILHADDAGRSLHGIASQHSAAGCTTLVAVLARLLVEANKTVAIVDANFTRPGLAPQLGLAAEYGWEDVLSGRISLAEAVVHSLGDQLSVLPLTVGGAAAASRLETIHASVTAGVLRYHYDVVLFDLGAIGDAQQGAIARRVIQQCRLDGALLAAAGGDAVSFEPRLLLQAAPELASICLGVVENQRRAA